jgi:hypothetical protein
MQAAPQGAVFIWCNSHIEYPKALARKIGRQDLRVERLSWLAYRNVAGLRVTGVVVDHAAKMDSEGLAALEYLRTRIRVV